MKKVTDSGGQPCATITFEWVAGWPMQDLYHKAIEGHLVLIVDAQCVTLAKVRGRTVAEEAGNPTIIVLLKVRDRP